MLLTLIIALGVSVQSEDTHYSESLNLTMHCERLSGSELTCYPHSDTTKGRKYSKTKWLPIINDSIQPKELKEHTGDSITCYPMPRGCE